MKRNFLDKFIKKFLKYKKYLIFFFINFFNFIFYFYKEPQQRLYFLPDPQGHGSFLPFFLNILNQFCFFDFIFTLFFFSTIVRFINTVIKSVFNLYNKFSNKRKASFLYSTKGSLWPYDLNPITPLNCSKYWIWDFQFWSISL